MDSESYKRPLVKGMMVEYELEEVYSTRTRFLLNVRKILWHRLQAREWARRALK